MFSADKTSSCKFSAARHLDKKSKSIFLFYLFKTRISISDSFTRDISSEKNQLLMKMRTIRDELNDVFIKPLQRNKLITIRNQKSKSDEGEGNSLLGKIDVSCSTFINVHSLRWCCAEKFIDSKNISQIGHSSFGVEKPLSLKWLFKQFLLFSC